MSETLNEAVQKLAMAVMELTYDDAPVGDLGKVRQLANEAALAAGADPKAQLLRYGDAESRRIWLQDRPHSGEFEIGGVSAPQEPE